MYKPIFFISLFAIFINVNAQFKEVSVPEHLKKAELYPFKSYVPMDLKKNPAIMQKTFDDHVIGQTTYDLQTFNALQQRIYAFPDGTIGLTYMKGFELGTWSDRSTGYNYFNETEWGSNPTVIPEPGNSGWPCYAPLGQNGELVVSFYYDGDTWGLTFNIREVKGEGEWITSNLDGPDGYGISNPAMITNGPDNNYIHLLVSTRGGEYMGQSRAVLYYRSLDGGDTWDITSHFFEELGAEFFTWIPGDAYSWAAPKGETIAFSVGFLAEYGFIMKSLDNGDSWERTTVYENPYSPYPGGATPTFGAGDITQSIALDSQDKAHVVFGRMKYHYDIQGNMWYTPATEGIIYWNEDMNPLDTTIVSSYTLDYLIENGNIAGWIIGDSPLLGWGLYYVSLTSFPQINIDDQDRIFLFYSGLSSEHSAGSKNFRHIYGNSSSDGGFTWNGITDCNIDLIYLWAENVFPAASPTLSDNKIHMFFQSDDFQGLHVWTNEHDPTDNNIVYMSIETALLTSTNESFSNVNESVEIYSIYPNPFHNYTNLTMDLFQSCDVMLNIFDIQGKILRTESFGTIPKGKQVLKFERKDLNSGIYYYSLHTNESLKTGKLIIQ